MRRAIVLLCLWGTLGGAQPQPTLELVRVVATIPDGSAVGIVDAAGGREGSIYVLFTDGTVKRYNREGAITSSWGGRGPRAGWFMRPAAIATHGDNIYVYDAALYAVSEFDASGKFIDRVTLPLAIPAPTSLIVPNREHVVVGGYAEGSRERGQVYQFCLKTECEPRSLGGARGTRDTLAFRFFQGGILTARGDSVFTATVNPLRIFAYRLDSNTWVDLTESSLLDDAESLAFKRDSDGRIQISNLYPQTTGFAALPDRRFVYSAFFPEKGQSLLAILDSSGVPERAVELPSYFAVKGVLPGRQVLVIRVTSGQQVAVYEVRDN